MKQKHTLYGAVITPKRIAMVQDGHIGFEGFIAGLPDGELKLTDEGLIQALEYGASIRFFDFLAGWLLYDGTPASDIYWQGTANLGEKDKTGYVLALIEAIRTCDEGV